MQCFSYAILLTAMLLFCIKAQAFCIYNSLDEGGSVHIYDEVHFDSYTAFRKTLEHSGAKECCHYENKDCNPSQSKTVYLNFIVQFKFNKAHSSQVFRSSCAAGGALAFYGSATNFYGECTPPDGLASHTARLMSVLVPK